MLNILKRFFSSKQEPRIEEISLIKLDSWFGKKVSELDYNKYFQEYFKQISDIQSQLNEKVELLANAEVSKDNKGVEARVKNIVKGHRDNYVREITRFAENLSPLEKDNFSATDDFQEVIKFNKELDKEIAELAKRTAKSYQATQHLFFDHVELVFKLMGELNLLVKNFDKRKEKENSLQLVKIQQLITNINEEKEKGLALRQSVKEKEERLKRHSQLKGEIIEELKRLKESIEFNDYKDLEGNREKLNEERRLLENEVFSFFSKLQKPLKKYERITLDAKPIKIYLEKSISAFCNDSELVIIEVLQKLRNSIDSLDFEDKQKKKFLELIDKGTTGYLEELAKREKRLKEKEVEIKEKMNNLTVNKEIKSKDQEKNHTSNKIEQISTEISDLRDKQEKINSDNIREELHKKIKDVFNIELSIKNSDNTNNNTKGETNESTGETL